MNKIFFFFSTNKDALTAIGIILTFLASIISLYFSVKNNKAVHYVNSITKSRIEWIGQLRNLSVEFCNACDLGKYRELIHEDYTIDTENIDKIKRTSMQIKLMLNFSDDLDNRIIKIMNDLQSLTLICYDIIDCINRYLTEDDHIDLERYSIQNLYDKEVYVQEFIIRFCKWNNIPVGDVNFINRKSVVEKCLKKIKENDILWKELEINFIKDMENTQFNIDHKMNQFKKYVQIYLKSEWNRVKYESQGKKYEKETQEFDLMELNKKYDNPDYENEVWKRFFINIKAKCKRLLKTPGFILILLGIVIIMIIA